MPFFLFYPIYCRLNYTADSPVHYNIAFEIFEERGYNPGYLPKRIKDSPIRINFSLELYQLIEINEPQQYMTINAWTVERWVDKLLGWNSEDHMNMTEILVPWKMIWLTDSQLYNGLVMDERKMRRLFNAKLTTKGREEGALVELLYPSIYKFACNLDLKFFPFDLQECRLYFGSWTFDATMIDYFPHNPEYGIGMSNCIENEGWEIIGTSVKRLVNKYACCPNDYVLLEFTIRVQRKPLYYIISLIIPTSIITFISIIGFFSSPSINDLREEKISLGITTLLSFSILVFMVSDKIPSTSSFILIGWFYISMILLISFGTLASSFVIFIQKKGLIGHFPDSKVMKYAQIVAKLIRMEMPLLMKQAYAKKAYEEKKKKEEKSKSRRNLWYKLVDAAKEQAKKMEEGEEEGKKASISSYYANADKSRDSIDSIDLAAPSTLRSLAQIEYDWLAAVTERIFFIIFISIFIFFSLGINLIGFYKWTKQRK